MSMLLRLLSLLFCVALLRAQGETFVHQFGEPGSTGSFRAQFVRAGAGVYFLQSTDHWRTLAAKQAFQKAAPDQRVTGDYLMLAYNHDNDHALRLFLAAANAAFPVDPAIAPWQVQADGATVRFTLDAGNGLVLEKVLRHDAKQRGFELELVLRNKNAQASGSIDFVLGGPTLISPQEPGLFLTACVGITAASEAEPQKVGPKAGVSQALPIDGKTLQFAGTSNRFFGAFLWPRDDAARAALRSCEIDTVPFKDDPVSGTLANTTLRARYGLSLPIPGQGAESKASFGLYLGPKSYREFATLPEPDRFAKILEVDLEAPCCFVPVPAGKELAGLLLSVLGFFHGMVGNWGLAIVMLTILVRGLLAPLNFHMQRSMRAYSARMAVLKPKMDALKKQHGDDQRAYQQAMIQFQRENKVLPPLGGCLPMFAVMPIYLGLFTALRTAYDVRQQPFIAWIDDLSRPDGLFQLPFWPGQLNLLPILWLTLMLVQVMRQPLPTDPQQRQQMQIMRYMPLIFGVMLYSYAAALLVYMVTSMLWTFVESAVIKRVLGPVDPNVAAMTPQTF